MLAIFLVLEYPGSPIPRVSTYVVPFSPYKYGCSPLRVFRQMAFQTYASSFGRFSHAPHFTRTSMGLTSKSTGPAGSLSPAPLAHSFCLQGLPIWKALSFYSEWIQYNIAQLPTFAGSPSLSSFLLSYSSTWFFPWAPTSVFLSQRPSPEPVIAPTPYPHTSPYNSN